MDSDILKDERIKCGICNDFFKDPTTIPCGHNFCMECISKQWDMELYEVYNCPKCSKSFMTRPELSRNETLCVIGNKLQRLRLKDGAQDGVVAELKKKNQKPQPQLQDKMKAKEKLQKMMCPQHERLLNFYCRDDKQCICEQCTLSEHMGHNTVTAVEERKERERKVKECLQKAGKEIHERELNLQKISNTFEHIKDSSTRAVDANRSVFSELTATLEKMKEELNKIIQEQEKVLLSQAQLEEKQQKLAIWSLQTMVTELEALSHVKDDISFITKSQPVVSQQEADPVTIHVNENLSFEFVTVALNKVKEMLEDGCKVAIENIQQTVRNVPLVKVSVENQRHPDRQGRPLLIQ
ncbi:E3 ubiquitin-protein ligase TRIM47-like [Colossoma macropomum]|uniref:E3 ubiquitin-protein ligase TRIM47-like n=1 Tax=Colossoma macropomum TaxID=42526 RepID=UPI001864D85E|nr:E3 ubiquitin-protein ligase TRIM47-like [Colossoma macropomum]